MIRLNELLIKAGAAPEDVTVMLHRPPESKARRLLPWLAVEHPKLFAAYQGTHNDIVAASVAKRQFIASFVAWEERLSLFVGLFTHDGGVRLPLAEIDARPEFAALYEAINIAPLAVSLAHRAKEGRLFFILQLRDEMREFVGRLAIEDPLGRAYARLATTLDAPVAALWPESRLTAEPPEWREFVLSAAEIRNLPLSWAVRLREWRGIYLILDETDGARYVGAAYGNDNILGRWRAHVAKDSGDALLLRKRDPANFRFSVLERTSPDMEASEVIALESTWKERLHTRTHGLNAN